MPRNEDRGRKKNNGGKPRVLDASQFSSCSDRVVKTELDRSKEFDEDEA